LQNFLEGDRPIARPVYLHRKEKHRKTQTFIHASSGIQTHDDPIVEAIQDQQRLRQGGRWDLAEQ
jgi:hypothetical protein